MKNADDVVLADVLVQLTELTDETTKLRVATEGIVPTVQAEQRRSRTTRILLGVQALVLLIVALLGLALWDVVRQQDRTTQQAFCPVFGLLLGGYNPESRPPGPDRDAYNATFATFTTSYQALECDSPIVPPAIRR